MCSGPLVFGHLIKTLCRNRRQSAPGFAPVAKPGALAARRATVVPSYLATELWPATCLLLAESFASANTDSFVVQIPPLKPPVQSSA